MTFSDVLHWNNVRNSNRGSQIANLRRRARPGMRPRRAITQVRAKTFHRQSQERSHGSSGGSPQNIRIIKDEQPDGAGEPVTQYEVAGTSSTLQPMANSKETSGDLAAHTNFI